jgi:hypothetical protein
MSLHQVQEFAVADGVACAVSLSLATPASGTASPPASVSERFLVVS